MTFSHQNVFLPNMTIFEVHFLRVLIISKAFLVSKVLFLDQFKVKFFQITV